MLDLSFRVPEFLEGDITQHGNLIAAVLANPVMIKAYLAGVPRNGKPFPDDAKCEFACHTMVKTRDYVFTDYGAQVKRYEQRTDER